MARKQVVIVTGSSGFIGYKLCQKLAEQYRVVGFDREGPPNPPKETEYVSIDLSSDQSVAEALDQVYERYGDRIASVVHLAAYYDFSGEPSDKYEEITVRGTQRLLQGLKRFDVEQFIFSSSMLVHAPCKPGETLNEDSPLLPKWDYPKSKVKTEELILQEHGSVPVVIMRIAGVYSDECQSIPLAHQIQRIYEKHMLSHVFPGDTSAGQSFIHIDDLLVAFEQAIEKRKSLPTELALVIAESETLSYEELQRTLGWLIHADRNWLTESIPKEIAKVGAWVQDKMPLAEEPFIKPWMIDLADDHYQFDISRARHYLNWQPNKSLRDTLPKMVESLGKDPQNWYKRNKLRFPDQLKRSA